MLTVTTLARPTSINQTAFDGRISLQPTEVRHEVSRLIANGQMPQADARSRELLRHYPGDEEALVTRILVCEVMLKWDEAALLLRQLLDLQGHQAPAEGWYHYVRVLNCLGDWSAARSACQSALAQHPGHPGLVDEWHRLGSEADRQALGSELNASE
jgi:hypothetical protein